MTPIDARVQIRITRFVAPDGRTPDGVSTFVRVVLEVHNVDPCQETYGDPIRDRELHNIAVRNAEWSSVV